MSIDVCSKEGDTRMVGLLKRAIKDIEDVSSAL
jgi:hypothetical protein